MRLVLYGAVSIFLLLTAGFSESFFLKNLVDFQFNWQLKDFSYFHPEGLWGGEAMEGTVACAFKQDVSSEIRTSVSLHKGHFLYDKWYVNWEETPLFLGVLGALHKNTFFLQAGDLRLGQNTTLAIKGQIDLEKKAFRLNKGRLSIGDTAKVYSLFCKQPLQAIYPLMERTEITGSLRVEAEELCLPAITGQLWASFEGAVSLPHVRFDGLQFHLPLIHTLPEETNGFIRIHTLFLQNEQTQNISVPLSVKAGTISLPEALHFSFAQGRVSLLSLEGTGYPFFFKGSLSLENMRPPDLPLVANLRSEVLHFELSPDYARIDGRIVIAALGGELIITNTRIEQILSRYPKIKADMEFRNIDLAHISRHFSFGEMSGIIKGHVKDLRIAYGQPESFDLLIESVAERGIRQTISLAAVNNISILAHGSPVVVSWLFPKTFPYQRIGIQCSLQNDYFLIHGLMKDDGSEYLIKRGLFGIDVVNRSPGQAVAFKEMVDRFKQISGREEK